MQPAEVESVIHSLIGVTSVVRAEHEMNNGVRIDKYTRVMCSHWCRWSGHTWRPEWLAGERRRLGLVLAELMEGKCSTELY